MYIIKKTKIGQILCEKGFLSQSQLEHALSEQKKRQDRLLGELLLELGYITEDQLQQSLDFQKQQEQR